MYKVFTSLWSKPALPTSAPNKTRLSSTTSSDSLSIDEDSWVFVNDTGKSNDVHRCLLFVFSLQLWCRKSLHRFCLVITIWAIVLWWQVGLHHLLFVRNRSFALDETNRSTSPTTHHFNPIENLLIEHASKNATTSIDSIWSHARVHLQAWVFTSRLPREHELNVIEKLSTIRSLMNKWKKSKMATKMTKMMMTIDPPLCFKWVTRFDLARSVRTLASNDFVFSPV